MCICGTVSREASVEYGADPNGVDYRLFLHAVVSAKDPYNHRVFAQSSAHYLQFLVVNSGPIELSVEQWNKTFNKMFPSSQSETKLWVRPDALHCITGEHFDKEIVYARFYLRPASVQQHGSCI